MSIPYCGLKHKVQGRTAPAVRPVANPFDLRVQDSPEYPTVLAVWCVDPINPQPSPITRSGPLFLPPNGSSMVLDWGLSRIFDVKTRGDARTL